MLCHAFSARVFFGVVYFTMSVVSVNLFVSLMIVTYKEINETYRMKEVDQLVSVSQGCFLAKGNSNINTKIAV
jgi:hypothetical protein